VNLIKGPCRPWYNTSNNSGDLPLYSHTSRFLYLLSSLPTSGGFLSFFSPYKINIWQRDGHQITLASRIKTQPSISKRIFSVACYCHQWHLIQRCLLKPSCFGTEAPRFNRRYIVPQRLFVTAHNSYVESEIYCQEC
jgi:hypothetical protein